MADETIGSIAVDIVGDYSQLQADLVESTNIAAAAGEKIAGTFTDAASGADALNQSVSSASAGVQSFEEQIQALVDSGKTLSEALDEVSASGAGIADEMQATGTAAEEATGGVESLGQAAAGIASSAESAAAGISDFKDAAHDAGDESESASSRVNELGEAFLEFAGFRLSVDVLRDFATEAVEVYASTEKATIALGLLTGDAAQASDTVEHLKEVAQDLAVPFESLVKMDQQMAAFGFSADETSQALTAAADAAAATGVTFDTAAQSLDRMALSGMAGTRQLVQLGLSAQDLADSMGVSVGDVTKDFKSLDESLRLDVLVDALQKFQGAAEQTADSTSGSLTRLKNAWALDMEQLGKDLAPVVTAFTNFYTNLDYYISQLIIRVEGWAASFKASLVATKDALTFDFSGAKQAFAEAAKADTDAAERLQILAQMHDQASKAIDNNTASTNKNIPARVASALADQQGAAAVNGILAVYKDFDAATLNFVSSETAAKDAAAALSIEWGHQEENLASAQRILDGVLQQYQQGNATWADVQKALNGVNQAQKALNDTFMSMPDITQPVQTYKEAIDSLDPSVKQLVAGTQDLGTYTLTATDILKKMGITVTDTGDAVSKLVGWYQKLEQTGNVTLSEEDAAWSKISGTLTKLSANDLPLVIKLYDQHIAQLQEQGAAEGQILDAQAKELTAIIAIDAQSGKSATDQIIGLNNIKLQQQALIDQTKLMGDMYVGVENDILTGWNNIGKGIADNIIAGQNWSTTFKNLLDDVAKKILETIVGTAFKAMEDALIKNTGLVGDLGDAFTKLGKTVSDAMGTAGAATQGAAGAAGSASGGAAGIAGSLGNMVTMLTGILSLVNGIIQDFQLAHLSKIMGEVEQNTRYTAIYTGEQGDSVLATLHIIRDQIGNEVVPDMESMISALGAVQDGIAGIVNGIQSIGTLGAGSGVGFGSNAVTVMTSGLQPGSSSPSLTGAATIPTSAGAGAMLSLPSVPSGSTLSSPPASTYSAAAGQTFSTTNVGGITIQAAQDPYATAKAVVDVMKTISPNFNRFNQ